MKHLLLLLTLIVGLTAVPATSFAKDKHKDKDKDEWKDSSKHLKNDLNALENHYDQVKDRIKYLGNGDRRLWEGLREIRSSIDRIRDQAYNGHSDGRDLSYRIDQAHNDLRSLQERMEYNNSRRGNGGGYYRRY
jgi:uncharacterized coiled-coil DUF342 family protein